MGCHTLYVPTLEPTAPHKVSLGGPPHPGGAYLGWTKESFTILTDHTNLTYWKSPQNLNRHTTHWHADLQEYDFKIKHIPGNTNIPADALSWPPGVDQGENDNQRVIMIPLSCVRTTITIDKLTTEFLRFIMSHTHDHVTVGHPGQDETIRKMKEIYCYDL